MKRKGFTLVELLVVIAIIAMLMGILMPALARVRQIAYRMVCGTNIAGIGKAIMIYANDNEENYPRAGGRKSWWTSRGFITNWQSDIDEGAAFGATTRAQATITSSFYLLIRNTDITPKQFLCKGDVGVREFKLSEMSTTLDDLTMAWDFGGDERAMPYEFCSYSYHLPYDNSNGTGGYPISGSSNPSCPVVGDRNPWLDKNADAIHGDATLRPSEWRTDSETGAGYLYDPDKVENAVTHQQDGQNVLFNDGHVIFAKKPNVGVDDDHIWKYWPTAPPPKPDARTCQFAGVKPTKNGDGMPMAESDAYLVNERQE